MTEQLGGQQWHLRQRQQQQQASSEVRRSSAAGGVTAKAFKMGKGAWSVLKMAEKTTEGSVVHLKGTVRAGTCHRALHQSLAVAVILSEHSGPFAQPQVMWCTPHYKFMQHAACMQLACSMFGG